MRRILSFDVGIKNLAYCLIEVSEVNEECDISNNLSDNAYRIIKWDIANLCGDPLRCCYPNCGTKGIYYKNNISYCKRHCLSFIKTGQVPYSIPPCNSQVSTSFVRDQEACSSVKLRKLAKLFGLATTKVPIDELREELAEKIEKEYFETGETTNAKDMDLVVIGRAMADYFDKLLLDERDKLPIGKCYPDIVLIENQVSPIANRMKTIQGMLAQYFICKDRLTDVHFISASNKLKDHTTNGEKTSYADRKSMGITVTQNWLKENNLTEWEVMFSKHKKKDDLADAFLQAKWFIEHKMK